MHYATDREQFERKCKRAVNNIDLVSLALEELHKFWGKAKLVCGPISTGGWGSVEENRRIFNAVMAALLQKEEPIFDLRPYEERIAFFRAEWRKTLSLENARSYYWLVLTEFYYPLIHSGEVAEAYFIEGWHESIGADWMRSEFVKTTTRIRDLDSREIRDILTTLETT